MTIQEELEPIYEKCSKGHLMDLICALEDEKIKLEAENKVLREERDIFEKAIESIAGDMTIQERKANKALAQVERLRQGIRE